MPTNLPVILAAAFALVAGQAAASEATPTVGELSLIQGQTMLLEAQAKRAAAKAEMLKNQADAGEDSAFVGQPSASVVASELPTVTGISTTGGRLYATFRYPNGTTSRAAAGESIPGGYQVTEISLERAVVTRGDRRIPLQTGVAAPAASENARGAFPGQMVPPPTANMLQRR